VLQNTQQKSLQAYQKRFMVTAGDKVKSVGIEDIAYFFAESRYVFLVCKDNRKYILDYTLDKLAECLNPDDFCRINRHVIVGFAAITEMYSYPKGRVKIVLTPHFSEEVIVSLSRAAEFKEWLNR
jgi:DNA-binding LytR/AlgR family response regulator